MTRFRLPLTAALALTLLAVLAVPAAANEDFRFDGKGWGHGIGMSQYGALEQARDGRSATQIIEHYYRSATVGAIPSSVSTLYVGLHQSTYRIDLVARGGDARIEFARRSFTAKQGRTYTFVVHGSDWSCNLKRHDNGSMTTLRHANECNAEIRWSGGTRIDLSSTWYDVSRGGLIVLRPHPDRGNHRFHVSARLPLETYMYGLAEVPYSWPMATLKAQVIAARSYAAHRVLSYGGSSSLPRSAKENCWCHVYDSVKDQVYAGWNREREHNWARWRNAVRGTAGLGVKADGQAGTQQGVVQAFYSSSSGGRTENIEDVWRGSTPRPFYSSVRDPWSLRSSNPYSSWTQSRSERTLRRQLRSAGATFDDLRSIRVVQRNESGSARTVRVTGTRNGSTKTIHLTGDRTRSIFNLRSAYIDQVFLPPFIDDDGSTFENDIVWVAQQGITKGCNPPRNDRYCPNASVTRGQMAAFIVRALGLTKTSSGGRFRDVPRDHTFYVDINKLATAGITKGCNPPRNDRYCPGEAVSRAEMAAFIVRAKNLKGTSRSGNFRDVPRDHTFYVDINKLATAGITKGCNPPRNDRYCPGSSVTRGQMAAFLRRGAPW